MLSERVKLIKTSAIYKVFKLFSITNDYIYDSFGWRPRAMLVSRREIKRR